MSPGTLEAIGYIDGREVAKHVVRTPGTVQRLDLWLDEGGRPFAKDGKDLAFLHVELRDPVGTTVRGAWENVFFGATGDVALVGANPFSSEAGIASILVQTETRRPRAAVYSLGLVRDGERLRVLSAAASVGGDVEPYEVRVATDGSEPGADAMRYDGPIVASGRVRAVVPGPGRPQEGALIDVSARGLRMRWESGTVREGTPLTIEILLQDPLMPNGPPRLVLDGKGRVVWAQDLGDEGVHAGIEFEAPMDLRRSFPEIQVF